MSSDLSLRTPRSNLSLRTGHATAHLSLRTPRPNLSLRTCHATVHLSPRTGNEAPRRADPIALHLSLRTCHSAPAGEP
jgi:hypothetical protein